MKNTILSTNYLLGNILLIFSMFSPIFTQVNKKTNESVIYNPLGVTPLSALYKRGSVNLKNLCIIVQGKTMKESIGVRYPAGYGSEFPIHGLYPAYLNTIIIREEGDEPKKFTINTPPVVIKARKKDYEPVPIKTDVIIDRLPESKIFNQNLYFTSLPNNHEILGFDRWGSMRYLYQSTNQNPWLIRITNDTHNVYFYTINNHNFYQKVDLLGRVFFRKKMKIHHEVIPYKNNLEIALGHSQWGWEDLIYILNDKQEIIQTIALGDVIKKATAPEDQDLLKKIIYDKNNIFVNPANKKVRIDWAHANSLTINTNRNELLISTRHLGILALDLDTWDFKWFFADPNISVPVGWKYAQRPLGDLYLTDVPSLKKYQISITPWSEAPRGQHALLQMSNGNLLLFDNQIAAPSDNRQSRIVEYSFDFKNKKASVIKKYYDPNKLYSQYVGDVDIIPDYYGDKILAFYAHAKPRRILEIQNDEIVFLMDIDMYTMAYKIDKYPLYPFPLNTIKPIDY